MSTRHALGIGLVLSTLATAAPAALDEDDKKWLQEVGPLLLDNEPKLLESLRQKEDRLEFRKIFWARRDPDLTTPENEFQPTYDARKVEADKRFTLGTELPVVKHTDKDPVTSDAREAMEEVELRQYRDAKERDALDGRHTDCGLVYIVFGEPDDIQKRTHTVWGSREPQSWTYKAQSNSRFTFDEGCAMPVGNERVRRALKEHLVVQPAITYHVKDGELLKKLADMMPKPSPMSELLRAPREDFALATQPAFLKTAEGTGLFGLIRGDAAGLFHEGAAGRKVRVVVRAEAQPPGGGRVSATEREMLAEVEADGGFVASYRLGVSPGPNAVTIAVVDANSGKGAVLHQIMDVPDFDVPETTIGSILALSDIETAGRDPKHPLSAFVIGDTRLVPRFGNAFASAEALTLSYQLYAPEGKGPQSARVRILRGDGTAVAESPEETFDTPVAGSALGPIPLARYAPGAYKVVLTVTDKATGRDRIAETTFEVKPPSN
jgi:hypothetical protein